ncbi:fimbria/pilus periplasmic chaperone [Paraburkholderia dinghuensis]|uniref:Molecular chaperone n=1 Tax=Paraburkholderia dinghuensis TaxID=2305225 RepID=A0A3N6MZL0_9BURK|nr:fimbria/pilus periplasmic chaperone [Paraburkholderia dinghuensis]RQH00577.1 molecular chaperone [Paraburkholderia dinghuensis]
MGIFRNVAAATAILVMSGLVAASASASVVITGTRVVYQEKDPEVTVRVTNDGKSPALVQTWIDAGNPHALPDENAVPFTILPPLFRLDPNKGQSLRLMYTHEPLAKDKESLYWLNVLEVPPRATGKDADPNVLRLALRTRIKLFFRPTGLAGDPRDAPGAVKWAFVEHDGRYVLRATNPTAYHVTFTVVSVKAGGVERTNDKGGMVDPQASTEFDMGNLGAKPSGPLVVNFKSIDDFGAGVEGSWREKTN